MNSTLQTHPLSNPAVGAKEAASYIGLHYKTLLELARQKSIASIRTKGGGRVLFRLSDLNAYLDSLRQEPTSEASSDEIDWNH